MIIGLVFVVFFVQNHGLAAPMPIKTWTGDDAMQHCEAARKGQEKKANEDNNIIHYFSVCTEVLLDDEKGT